jgi:hypothetical protein
MSYLESTALAAVCEIAVSIKTAGCACFACRALSLRPPSTSYTRLPPLWQEKKAPVNELDAHTTANGYQRGAHWEEDSRRDGNKQEDKTRKDQERSRSRCDVGSLCDVRGRYLHPEMIDAEVESQLALHSVSRGEAKPAYRPSVAIAYASDAYLRDAYR